MIFLKNKIKFSNLLYQTKNEKFILPNFILNLFSVQFIQNLNYKKWTNFIIKCKIYNFLELIIFKLNNINKIIKCYIYI